MNHHRFVDDVMATLCYCRTGTSHVSLIKPSAYLNTVIDREDAVPVWKISIEILRVWHGHQDIAALRKEL